jgi:hypothetical protein
MDMAKVAKSAISAHEKSIEQVVSFDKEGNVVVNKESSASNKLMARRAIEAHLERKNLEKDLTEYYFEGV